MLRASPSGVVAARHVAERLSVERHAKLITYTATDGVVPGPAGAGWCDTIPEAFRSRGAGWPVIGTQFHAEQRQFAAPAPGDPSESVDDPRLFFASAFEQIVDAYERAEAGGPR